MFSWAGRHLAGKPAVTLRRLGRGQILYVGTYLTRGVVEALLPLLKRWEALPPPLSITAGVEVVARMNAKGRKVFVAINHNEHPVRVAAPDAPLVDYLEASPVAPRREFDLGINGVALWGAPVPG